LLTINDCLKGYIIGMKDMAVGAVQILYVTVIPAGPLAVETLDPGEFTPGASVQLVNDCVTTL
jgi:hypothetical protein